ncbi:MAG TPA: M14 family zinc carboxypeptidase [Coriobacteriia bacterium]|jgi:predicted deacylase
MALLVKGKHSRRGRLEPLIGRVDLLAVVLALACAAAAAGIVALLARPAPRQAAREVAAVDPFDVESPAEGTETGWRVVGRSAEGRAIRLTRIGTGPRRVLLVGGVHGNEYGSDVASAFAAFLALHPEAVPASAALDVVPCLDPDGAARDSRGNAHGVDLNRNFPSRDWRAVAVHGGLTAGPRPASEPETRVMLRVLTARYACVVSLHSLGPLVDYDGPGGAALARAMGARSRYPIGRLAATERFTGSMGAYVPERYGIPIVTVELGSRRLTPGVRDALLMALR